MKKQNGLLAIALASIIGTAAAQQVRPLQLSGTITSAEGRQVYLQRYDNKVFRTVDSTGVNDGKFQFTTAVVLPELYGITLDTTRGALQVFLEEGPITVTFGDGNGYRDAVITGSKAQQRFDDFRTRQRGLKPADFIKEDPASIVAAYVLFRNYSYGLSPQEIREHVQLLDVSLHNTQYVRILNDLATVQESVLPGKKAIDFVSSGPDGNPVRFSDHLGKGYVLLDFWAAWCGPCRKENPNIVAAFKKYKDNGFNVFGVSLDKDRESWLKAIKDDGLDWPQVSDLAFWDTEAPALYGVRFIPSNLLIDPNGVVVARNIKGEDLHLKLAEIFGH